MKPKLFCVPLLALALAAACNTNKLEPGGAYAPATTNAAGVVTATGQPDLAFYAVDSAFELGYMTAQAVLDIERNNRAMFWKISPQIKRSLDTVRRESRQVKLAYAQARAVYKANPVPANLPAMEAALAEIQRVAADAAAALPQQPQSVKSEPVNQ